MTPTSELDPYYRLKRLKQRKKEDRNFAAQKPKLIFGTSSDFCQDYRSVTSLTVSVTSRM